MADPRSVRTTKTGLRAGDISEEAPRTLVEWTSVMARERSGPARARMLADYRLSRTRRRGRRDRAVVMNDAMAVRHPEARNDSTPPIVTRHRLAALHPRQHADNPGRRTSLADFAETLTGPGDAIEP